MICVVTAVAAGWDNLRKPDMSSWRQGADITPDTRFICYTDNPLQPPCWPWEFRTLPIMRDDLPRSSRIPKILPHLLLPEDCEYSIWHDANFQLRANPVVIVETLLKNADWAAHRHPVRTCLYEEAELLIRENIGTLALIESDVKHFRIQGHPPHFGLWANGFIVRRHTREVNAMAERWWQIHQRGCERDQISFPVALREHGIAINTINADVYNSPWIKFNWHAAFKTRGDNSHFFAERKRIGERLERLAEVTGVRVPYRVNVP